MKKINDGLTNNQRWRKRHPKQSRKSDKPSYQRYCRVHRDRRRLLEINSKRRLNSAEGVIIRIVLFHLRN